MFKLSKKAEYGILALQHMMVAENGHVSTVKEIAEQHSVSQSLLAKICQQLAKSKIIQSVQGSRGGYTLNMPPEDVTLFIVLQAIDGPLHIVECTHQHHLCDRDENCTLKMGLDPIQQRLETFLQGVTLVEFAPNPQGEFV